jgi:YbbR domain-containing protein
VTLRRSLGAILYNWPLKVAAIVLASLLYAGLVVSQSAFDFPGSGAVTIVPQNIPSNAVILGDLPPISRIRYIVTGDAGTPPTPKTFLATIDLANVDPRAGLTSVNVDVTSTDSRFVVVDYEPRRISVQLDPFITKTVPVNVVKGPIPSNLDVRDALVSPDSVAVSGPESVVRLVVAAQANVVIDPKGLDVDRDVALIPVDISGNLKSPADVTPTTARVKIAVFSNRQTRSLAVNPVVTGTPPVGYEIASVAVNPPVVSVEGDPDELAPLDRADTQPIPIGAATSGLEIDVPLALPEGVLPIGIQTVHVSVKLKPETGTRTFGAGVLIQGGQTDLDYQALTGQVQVTIGGPVADLDRLAGSTIAVTVNVAGLGPGTHVLTPTLNVQAGLQPLAIEPGTVTISISRPATPGSASAAPS